MQQVVWGGDERLKWKTSTKLIIVAVAIPVVYLLVKYTSAHPVISSSFLCLCVAGVIHLYNKDKDANEKSRKEFEQMFGEWEELWDACMSMSG
jgi:hypothetical protein